MSDKILITGCGRSGTKYISKVFRRLGVKLGHEVLYEDGIVSTFSFLLDDLKTYSFILHQVRHPLNVISSCQTLKQSTWDFFDENKVIKKVDPLLLKCMNYWLNYNRMVLEVSNYTYKVEDFSLEVPHLFSMMHRDLPDDYKARIKKVSRRTNRRKHSYLTWDDLFSVDESLTNEIINLGNNLGYTIEVN
jgi:hypothetical protein